MKIHLMIDYIFSSYGTFYRNILCNTTKFTEGLISTHISRTLIRISSFGSSKSEWNLNNMIVSSWPFSIKPLRSFSSPLDFHIRQVMVSMKLILILSLGFQLIESPLPRSNRDLLGYNRLGNNVFQLRRNMQPSRTQQYIEKYMAYCKKHTC